MRKQSPSPTRRCIETSVDIKEMVDAFYDRIRQDSLVGPVFDTVVKVDWQKHLPRMYAFWTTVALHQAGYKGNPIEKHQDVARRVALEEAHFDRWLTLFEETVDERFEGEASGPSYEPRIINELLSPGARDGQSLMLIGAAIELPAKDIRTHETTTC